jgi:hypothetical protein
MVGSEIVAPQTLDSVFSGDSVTVANPQPVGPFARAVSPAEGPVGGGTTVTVKGQKLRRRHRRLHRLGPVVLGPAGRRRLDRGIAAGTGLQGPAARRQSLPAARRVLRRSGCRLGAVRGHSRTGNKVARQSPRPGVTRRACWDVNVTIR